MWLPVCASQTKASRHMLMDRNLPPFGTGRAWAQATTAGATWATHPNLNDFTTQTNHPQAAESDRVDKRSAWLDLRENDLPLRPLKARVW